MLKHLQEKRKLIKVQNNSCILTHKNLKEDPGKILLYLCKGYVGPIG